MIFDRFIRPPAPEPAALARPHQHCQFCGKRIAAGKFCTGTHANLFIARFGSPSDLSPCTKECA